MDPESTLLSEVSETEEEHHVTALTCGIQKEIIQMNLQNRNSQT